ncbi:MAG: Gfo/Idh/MocA family oxidoreductase [Alphaproteobacteria bacterium]|nr:Gfo/Idh/MocA family oxidoreductase [Alphaproteobacteria bacterium]
MADVPVRIGILGAGAMGTTHAATYASLADVTVVGVFARDPSRAHAAAALCKAEPFTDVEALIRHADVDAIDVCLPSAIHCDFVIAALDAGKHVFCETPLALQLDEAHRMRDAARRAGRLLQIGLLMRALGAYRHIKDVAVAGTYGRLLSVTTWRLGSYLHPDAPDHKAHYSEPATELMTFDFDFIQWLMGQPNRLSASSARTARHTPGETSALLSYDDGRHAAVLASGLMPPGFAFTAGFRALFDRAVFEHQAVFDKIPPTASFTIVEGKEPARSIPMPNQNPYEVELQRFVDCIRGRADSALFDAGRAIEALVLSTATQRSLEEARSVEIV